MKLIHIPKDGSRNDVTNLVRRYTWSGDYRAAARHLELSFVASSTDYYLPKVTIALGDALIWYDDAGDERFRGYVFRKTKSVSSGELSVTAYDGLIYLTKSKLSKVFRGVTAEEVTRNVCTQLGVPVGSLAATGLPHTFIHLGKTGYEAIQSGYTMAHKQNGKVYMPRMNAGALDVIVKGSTIAKRLNVSEEHVSDSMYREDIESMINRVVITDSDGNKLGTVANNAWIRDYGVLQDVYEQKTGEDARSAAMNLLSGISRESTVDLIGGSDTFDMITGNAIKIQEAFTGLTGLFYIDTDSHIFENGQHSISLTVNFQNVMDEQVPDQDPNQAPGSKDVSYLLDDSIGGG
jgi:hypothetical protein